MRNDLYTENKLRYLKTSIKDIPSYFYDGAILGSRTVGIENPLIKYLNNNQCQITQVSGFIFPTNFIYTDVRNGRSLCDFGVHQYPKILDFINKFLNYEYPFLDENL